MCQVVADNLSINNRTDKLQDEINSKFLVITYQTCIPEIFEIPDIFSKFLKLLEIHKKSKNS
jgi:hypothetical protein